MALITGLALFASSVLVAVLSRLAADEFRAWNPTIIRSILRTAVLRLPEAQRERFAEEWAGHLSEVPGEIGRLLVAVGFVLAAHKIARMMKAKPGIRARFLAFCIQRWFVGMLIGGHPPFINDLLHFVISSKLVHRVLWPFEDSKTAER